MKNNKLLMACIMFGIATLAVTTLVAPNSVQQGNAEPKLYTMTFSNTKNKINQDIYSTDLIALTDAGGKVEMNYMSMNPLEGGWASLQDGSIMNKDPINGIKSIEVIADNAGDTVLDVWYDVAPEPEYYVELTHTDNVYSHTFTDEVKYLDIYLLVFDRLNIIEMTITYSCIA